MADGELQEGEVDQEKLCRMVLGIRERGKLSDADVIDQGILVRNLGKC